MTDEERARLAEFLRKKMCGPCRREGASPDHEGCIEAEELIAMVERDSRGP